MSMGGAAPRAGFLRGMATLAAADSLRAAYDAIGSPDKTFVRVGLDTGFSVDFGHDDLLAGLAAPAEVFPRIADWLAARSAA
jgi:hypothetical protein